jgi:hypothetical protein
MVTIRRILRSLRDLEGKVTVAGNAKKQVFSVLPGLDDNPFENDFVDHGSLLKMG